MARVWNFIGKFGSVGSGDGQFLSTPEYFSPSGIAGNNQYIYAGDVGNNRVQIFDRNSYTFVAKFGTFGTGNGQFNQPFSVAIDDNYIYVLDAGNQRIEKFDIATYAYMSQVSIGELASDMCLSGGILYVLCVGKVKAYESSTLTLVHTYTDSHINTTGFIAADYSYFYVTSVPLSGQCSVAIFNKLAYSSPFVSSFNPVGNNILIQGIAVDINSIYVSDTAENKIKLFDINTHAYTEFFGSVGSGNGQMLNPGGLYFDKFTSQIFVADVGNNRAQIFGWDYLAAPADPTNLTLTPSLNSSVQLTWQDNS